MFWFIVMFFVVPVVFGVVEIIKTKRADARRAAWQSKMEEMNKPLPEVFEVLWSGSYGKGEFKIELTTSWHNRHRFAPYYLRVVGERGVMCTSELFDNVDDCKAVGMGQVRWNAYLIGLIPMEMIHSL